MEVTLSAEQQAQLLRIADRTGKDAQVLAHEAIVHLLEHEEHFIAAVEKGLASLDRGEFLTHAEVHQRIGELLRP